MSDLFADARPAASKREAESPAEFGSDAWVWCRCGRPASIHFKPSGLRLCMRCAIADGRGYRTEPLR